MPKMHPVEVGEASWPTTRSSFQISWSGFLDWMNRARSWEKVRRLTIPSRTRPNTVSELQEQRSPTLEGPPGLSSSAGVVHHLEHPVSGVGLVQETSKPEVDVGANLEVDLRTRRLRGILGSFGNVGGDQKRDLDLELVHVLVGHGSPYRRMVPLEMGAVQQSYKIPGALCLYSPLRSSSLQPFHLGLPPRSPSPDRPTPAY